MRRKQEKVEVYHATDDADAAAGITMPPAPRSKGLSVTSASDLEFFEDLVSEPVLVLGQDISHMSRKSQFLLCASGVFGFSLLYGFLQELLSVQLCSRQLGLYLAMVQFTGYTILSFILRTYVYESQKRRQLTPRHANSKFAGNGLVVPFGLYLGLSLLRALDLGMTNMAMQYVNYPAKTLMKSARVVFTMLFGVLISKKSYRLPDYLIVLCIFAGLVIFMHADANSSAVFAPTGVMMLTVSLICDGAITNMSENIMNRFGVGQDEFIFRMYSIALVAISAAAILKGDFASGVTWMLQSGTYEEQLANMPMDERTWSVSSKIGIMTLFSTMGFFGSSCSAAITKNFGALSMSLTSTARKATTLFLSFLLFHNECTMEHILGIVIFMGALTAKSFRRTRKNKHKATPSASSRRADLRRRANSRDTEQRGIPRVLGSTSSFEESVASATQDEAEMGLLDTSDGGRQPRSAPHFARQSTEGRHASGDIKIRHSPKVRYHVV